MAYRGKIKDFKLHQDEDYRIFRGVIEDNNDPEKRGRCKIRIFGLHGTNKRRLELEGAPTDELP